MAELGFQGLLLHGPGEAFARLGELMVDKQSAEQLLKLFSHLIETHGVPLVSQLTEEAAAHLPPDAARALDKWWIAWGYAARGFRKKAVALTITIEHRKALAIDTVREPDRGWDAPRRGDLSRYAGSFVRHEALQMA